MFCLTVATIFNPVLMQKLWDMEVQTGDTNVHKNNMVDNHITYLGCLKKEKKTDDNFLNTEWVLVH